MAVREFNGTSDLINFATGSASGFTHGTVAAIIKVSDTATARGLLYTHDSGDTDLGFIGVVPRQTLWQGC